MVAAEVTQHNVEVHLSKEPYPQMLGAPVWAIRLTPHLRARACVSAFVGSRLHVFVILLGCGMEFPLVGSIKHIFFPLFASRLTSS